MKSAQEIVDMMMKADAYSQWLGITIKEVTPGSSHLEMTVRPEMCNGFGVAHGGISYSLADSALAFASNGHGIKSMSIETSISHTAPIHPGDKLTVIASELSLKNKIAIYEVRVTRGADLVALFKGTVYRSGKEW